MKLCLLGLALFAGLHSFAADNPFVGQLPMSLSSPVVIANDQSAFPVNAVQSGPWAVTANAGTNLNTSLLALDTSVNGLLLSQGSSTAGQKGVLPLGAVSTSAPSYTNGQSSPLSLTTGGSLRVDTLNPLGAGNVNLAKVGGSNISLGQNTMANSIPVTLSSDQSSLPRFQDSTSGGTISVLNGAINLVPNGESTATIQITGTWVGTLTLQGTNDGTNYNTVTGSTVPSGALVTAITANGNWRSNISAYSNFRIIATAWTSGTATVTIFGSSGLGILRVFQTNPESFQVGANGKYNSSLPSLNTGDRNEIQLNKFGELAIVSRNLFRNITGIATTTVKSGAGRLHNVCINSGLTAVYTIYDNTAASGTTIAIITNSTTTNVVCAAYNVEFSTGLTIVTTGVGTNITIGYQ